MATNKECIRRINLQATKLFIVTSATKGGVTTPHLRFSVRFKILYRVSPNTAIDSALFAA